MSKIVQFEPFKNAKNGMMNTHNSWEMLKNALVQKPTPNLWQKDYITPCVGLMVFLIHFGFLA